MSSGKTVIGLRGLLDSLEQLAPGAENEVAAYLEDGAQFIEENAKKRCPVDTGKLRQSIRAVRIDNLTYDIQANATGLAPYATYVEYGTRRMRAQPFMRPAYFAGIQKLTREVDEVLKRQMRRL